MTSLLLTLSCLAPVADTHAQPPSCPTPHWDEVLRKCNLCPAPAAQPFQRLPRVCQVKPCPCDDEFGSSFTAQAWVKEFHEAASVTYPRFGLDHCPLPGDGLVIYEGMKLKVDPVTGMYDVSFTASVPGMPATLRLQLIFDEPPPRGRQYRLTLPPIRLEPPKDAKPTDYSAHTFHVAHRGYSSLFRTNLVAGAAVPPDGRHCEPSPPINCDWNLRRIGTARFGTGLGHDDQSRY
jgi:hypothetical protein